MFFFLRRRTHGLTLFSQNFRFIDDFDIDDRRITNHRTLSPHTYDTVELPNLCKFELSVARVRRLGPNGDVERDIDVVLFFLSLFISRRIQKNVD